MPPKPASPATNYAAEKYEVAVRSLATGTDIQTRMRDAFLSITRLQRQDLADLGLWNQHRAITEELTAVKEGPGDGDLEKTLNTLSEEDLTRLADSIVSLAYEIQRVAP